jgi:Tol biopolymer transport system component
VAKSKHLGALAAVAGILAAVGLLVVLVAGRPAEATFPGQPGKIAYSGSVGNDKDIYTINPNGRGKFQVTKNDTGDSDPSYSPNGKRIAYSGYDGNDQEIYTIDTSGGGRVQVTKNGAGDFSPSWGSQ